MHVVTKSTDRVRLGFIMALLRDGGLSPVMLDTHVNAIEAGIGAFPIRIAVPDDELAQARRILREAEGEVGIG